MMTSLRDKVLPLRRRHRRPARPRPETTIGRERARNPYLREV